MMSLSHFLNQMYLILLSPYTKPPLHGSYGVYPQNIASPWLIISLQPSGYFRNDGIGEWGGLWLFPQMEIKILNKMNNPQTLSDFTLVYPIFTPPLPIHPFFSHITYKNWFPNFTKTSPLHVKPPPLYLSLPLYQALALFYLLYKYPLKYLFMITSSASLYSHSATPI